MTASDHSPWRVPPQGVLAVPMTISYDTPLEEESMMRELAGMPKVRAAWACSGLIMAGQGSLMNMRHGGRIVRQHTGCRIGVLRHPTIVHMAQQRLSSLCFDGASKKACIVVVDVGRISYSRQWLVRFSNAPCPCLAYSLPQRTFPEIMNMC